MDDDGEYSIYDNFSNINPISLTLTGTTSVDFYSKYQRTSGIVSIEGTIPGSPSAIFSFSKNDVSREGNITKLCSTFGSSTLESLFIIWSVNNKLAFYKDGTNYDGEYNLRILT